MVRVEAAAVDRVDPVDAATRSGNVVSAGLISAGKFIGLGRDVAGRSTTRRRPTAARPGVASAAG
ncbi:hypothetical protein ACFVH0_13735 [Streptomyces sp. NPDC127117]|uniref:hypothetical protein n=1 Tax=Streptomyces sp. NPDC127117 TaxID=3345368 RepID=UPI0036441770